MRDRLIELIKSEMCVKTYDNGEFIETEVNVEEIADYLLANGVIVSPCKTGDNVYLILYAPVSKKFYIKETKAGLVHCINGKWGIGSDCSGLSKEYDFGVKAFTNKEDAERALKVFNNVKGFRNEDNSIRQ